MLEKLYPWFLMWREHGENIRCLLECWNVELLEVYKIFMSFLFGCCQTVESKEGYEVRRRNQKDHSFKFTSSIAEIPKQLSKNDLANENFQVLKIEKSQYTDLVNQYKDKKQKWVDPIFSPCESSLGPIPGIKHNNLWKRISDILAKPTLFEGPIDPKDVIQGSINDCYFLSALAALAEREEYIRAVFEDQTCNPNGIYKATLRIDGEIKEIIVDDFVPVSSKGEPLFCQPNKSEIWALILEKAWAKAHGSYGNIVAGTPCEIFKAVTYSPTESYSIKESEEENEKIWKILFANLKSRYIGCCTAKQDEDEDWENLGLEEGQTYTLINAAELVATNGKIYKIVELKNPWGVVEWNGKASQNDRTFWDSLKESDEKQEFLKKMKAGNNGVFFMKFKDFCKYFNQIHFSLVEQNGNYIYERVFCNKKNGSLLSFNVEKPGNYVVELHQSNESPEGLSQLSEEIYRSTLLLIRVSQKKIGDQLTNSYEFVDGMLRYNDHDTTMKVKLTPGKYLIYAKVDPNPETSRIADKVVVSMYSTNFIMMSPSNQQEWPNLLKSTFLNHARFNKRQTYNNDLMWIAWKLLYQQGGYAYLAFGNHPDSNKKFIITFDEEQFSKLNFRLKKPFKGKGNGQLLEILPGQEQIILCRVNNVTVKGLKFPPRISIKLEYMNPDQKSTLH